MDYKYNTQNMDINTELLELQSEKDRRREMVSAFLQDNYTFILIIRILICILTVANNAFFIFVILKFKKLRTKKNYIIMNFAVLTAAYSIACVVAIVTEKNVSNLTAPVMVIADLLLQLTFILATVLALNWYFVKTFPDFVSGNQGIYKWIIVVAYIIPLLYFVPAFIAGYHWIVVIRFFSLIIFLVCFLIIGVLVVIQFTRNSDNVDADSKFSSGASLAGIYFLLWGIVILTLVALMFLPLTYKLFAAFYHIHFVGLLSAVVTILIAIRRDKDIKMAYADIFNRSDRNLPPENNVTGENEMLNMPKSQNTV